MTVAFLSRMRERRLENTQKHLPRKEDKAEAEHGNKNKQRQKNLPRTNTEFHGKDRSRATETKQIFQSRMRERRLYSSLPQ